MFSDIQEIKRYLWCVSYKETTEKGKTPNVYRGYENANNAEGKIKLDNKQQTY